MDSRRKANREDHEITLQYQTRQEAMRIEAVNEEKLVQLLAALGELDQTPAGAVEIQRRTRLFGACQRIDGETAGQYYARLQHWFERALPQTKLPLHAPRQTGA